MPRKFANIVKTIAGDVVRTLVGILFAEVSPGSISQNPHTMVPKKLADIVKTITGNVIRNVATDDARE